MKNIYQNMKAAYKAKTRAAWRMAKIVVSNGNSGAQHQRHQRGHCSGEKYGAAWRHRQHQHNENRHGEK